MSAFTTATALTPVDDGRFAWEVPDGWHQGRGSWGGLPIGAMIRAVTRAEHDPERIVRTVSLQIAAPAFPGAHSVAVTPVRIGKGMSTWAVRIEDADGGFVAGGTVITGVPRASAADRDVTGWSPVTAPVAPPAADVPIAQTPPPFPEFTTMFEYRVHSGFPLMGDVAETLGWINYRDPVAPSDISLLALVDAWYSVNLVPLRELLPISTVNFTANLLIDPATLSAGEPLLHHGLVSGFGDGYTSEQRRLWTSDGRLAVDNLQTIVVG